MGLKDWLGKMAGPKSYGDALGRQARENGSALANIVFMSHGSGSKGREPTIFHTSEQMRSTGFRPRYTEVTQLVLESLNAEEQVLLKSLQVAMVTFAFTLNSNGAQQYMKRDNTL